MRTKPFASLACALAAGALILPACGGDDSSDSAPAAADDLRVLEQRVGAIERQLRDLRKELKSQGKGKRASSDAPGDQTATEAAADRGGASAPEGAAGDTQAASVTGSGDGGSESGGGGGSGSGGGGGSRSGGGGSGGTSDPGAGPDPGTPEDDRSVEAICGPNPAPEC